MCTLFVKKLLFDVMDKSEERAKCYNYHFKKKIEEGSEENKENDINLGNTITDYEDNLEKYKYSKKAA